MAQGKSDGTVYIDTRIDTSGIGSGFEDIKSKLNLTSNSVKKFGKNVQKSISEIFSDGSAKNASLYYEKVTNEINELEKEYRELGKAIEKDEKLIARLQTRQLKLRQIGANTDTLAIKGMDWDILEADRRISEMTPKYNQLAESISRLKAQQAEISRGVDTKRSSGQLLNLKDSLDKVKKSAGSAFLSLMKFAGNTINRGLNKLSTLFQRLVKSLIKVEKTAEKSGYSMTRMLGSSILFSTVFKAINTLTTGFGEGLIALAENSDSLNNTLSSLKSNLLQLRNTFVSAFAPLIQIVVPYIEIFIAYLTKALNYVAQLIASLLGQDTYKKALEVSASFIEVEKSANDAKKALQGYLSPLDEISRFNSKDIEVPNIESAGNGNLFEDVPIESSFKNLADKIKGIFASLFAPLKEAWDEVGQFVMDSWLYALDEAWKLIKDIGRDFLEVWNQTETINIFEDILRIIGDIGLTIGILLQNFREAWNYAETGKRILEGIRDIIGVITDNFLHAADATVEWAKRIDFTPLLTKIQELISSLIPVFDSLSGIMTDFYENVILPLGEWVLEEGLPDLLQVFIDFNNEVDWESLRTRLNEFWKALEPFAETVGAGLVEFIERISERLSEFVNSKEFDDFLTTIEDWMKNVSPDDVADGLENLAKSLISLKIAVLGFSAVSTALTVFEKLGTVLMGLGKAVEYLRGIQLIPFLTQLFTVMNPGMIGEIGIKISDLLTGSFLDPREWDNWFGELYTTVYDGINNFIDTVIGPAILFAFNAIGQIFINTFNWDATLNLFSGAIENFKKGGANIIFGVIEGILGAIGFIVEPIGDFFTGALKAFSDFFGGGVDSPAEKMKPLGENIILGVIEGMKAIFENVKATIEELKTIISDKFKEIISDVDSKFKELKSKISTKLSDIKSSWDSKWQSFADKVSDVWGNITSTVSSAIESIKGWIDGILSKFKEVKESISSLSSSKSSKKSSLFSGIYIPNFSNIKIPKLATGAVIPPNAPFMAMLGDQRHGTNIEAPLDTIKQAVREVVGSGKGGVFHAHLYLDGREVFDTMIDIAKMEQTANGVNPMLLT